MGEERGGGFFYKLPPCIQNFEECNFSMFYAFIILKQCHFNQAANFKGKYLSSVTFMLVVYSVVIGWNILFVLLWSDQITDHCLYFY